MFCRLFLLLSCPLPPPLLLFHYLERNTARVSFLLMLQYSSNPSIALMLKWWDHGKGVHYPECTGNAVSLLSRKLTDVTKLCTWYHTASRTHGQHLSKKRSVKDDIMTDQSESSIPKQNKNKWSTFIRSSSNYKVASRTLLPRVDGLLGNFKKINSPRVPLATRC